MKEASNVIVKGIKCDNPECDFKDMSVNFEDYKNWVNRPCPKCGANLLTTKDYNACRALLHISNFLNKIIKVPNDYNGEEDVVMHVDMDGSGVPTFKIRPTETYKPKPELNTAEYKLNKINAEWLENALLKAKKENKTKSIEKLDVDTLKGLVYGYFFTTDCLAYFFNSTREEVIKKCEKEHIDFNGISTIKYKIDTKGIYDVDTIYNNCIL